MAKMGRAINLLKIRTVHLIRQCHRLQERADVVYKNGNTEQWEAYNEQIMKHQEIIEKCSAILFDLGDQHGRRTS